MKAAIRASACAISALALFSGILAATASTPAYAVSNTPDINSLVAGPNCDGMSHFFRHDGTETGYLTTGGDYTGYTVYGNKLAPVCNDDSEYVYTDPTGVDETWVWGEGTAFGDSSVAGDTCYIWAYIPSENAGAPNARYDIWATDNLGISEVNAPAGWHWLFWPGRNINQENTTGWVYFGEHTVGNYPNIAITLTNEATAGWEIAAGSVAIHCV